MKCSKCKFYRESREENECLKFGFYCFHTFCKRECSYIDDDYNLTKNGLDLDKVL